MPFKLVGIICKKKIICIMAAPNTERTCALLIGSGKCYRDEKGTVKKGGIKLSRNKRDVPDGVWAQRDLDNMDRFLKSKGADCVDSFNYEDLVGTDFANGKHDVIERIEKHFEKEAKYSFSIIRDMATMTDRGFFL